MKNQKTKTTKAHPELGEIDVNITSFGEIDGRLDSDKNVADKKLSNEKEVI